MRTGGRLNPPQDSTARQIEILEIFCEAQQLVDWRNDPNLPTEEVSGRLWLNGGIYEGPRQLLEALTVHRRVAQAARRLYLTTRHESQIKNYLVKKKLISLSKEGKFWVAEITEKGWRKLLT